MRRSPGAVAGALSAAILTTLLAAGACRPAAPSPEANWTIAPDHPSVGDRARVRLTLRTRAQAPVSGARLRLEAQMTHPGMPAMVVPMTEPSAGVYDAVVQFSMRGNWVLVASGELADGTHVTKDLAVTGVTER
jgi:hypothetical protein